MTLDRATAAASPVRMSEAARFDERHQLASATGATLDLHIKRADGAPRAVVQINHGLAEHAARYAPFAARLARAGFDVYAHDHRGHGHTKAPDAPLASFGIEDEDAVLGDVAAVHGRIAGERPGLPVIIFGHSMGGLITLNYLARYPAAIRAAAIWNSNFGTAALDRAALALLAWERFRLGSDVPSRLMPRLTFHAWAKRIENRRTEFDWLSRDPMQVEAYIADPLCAWDPSVGMWIAIFRLMKRGSSDAALADIPRNLPLNLVGGADDPSTDGGKAVRTLENRLLRIGFSNLETTIYEATRHESLNELNRDLIMDDFIAWLEKSLQPPR